MRLPISLVLIAVTQLKPMLLMKGHEILQDNDVEFWIEVELHTVHWKPSCLTTGGCAHPRFRISKFNKVNNEIISVSWSITENFVEKHSRKFITHWVNGKPHEITMHCEVIGMDPLYGFLRTCDTTQTTEIFSEEENNEEVDSFRISEANDELATDEQLDKLIIEIRAKCFNASLAVRKFTNHCPWCSKQKDIALVSAEREVNWQIFFGLIMD
ncbi:unnamed protein product [Thelazia callipaeda]|uniref:Secreted protein n=1 Tax=Thelazia callipaeda TaxID=103827 RepID=A0A0N5D0Q7_THECL|nr:unnamed protein product [Thelazia callipaeda]